MHIHVQNELFFNMDGVVYNTTHTDNWNYTCQFHDHTCENSFKCKFATTYFDFNLSGCNNVSLKFSLFMK